MVSKRNKMSKTLPNKDVMMMNGYKACELLSSMPGTQEALDKYSR